MELRKDYPFDEAINDLEVFIERIIIHDEVKTEFRNLFIGCKKEKRIPMRWVNVRLAQYGKEYKVREPFTDKEKEMLEDLMYFWG